MWIEIEAIWEEETAKSTKQKPDIKEIRFPMLLDTGKIVSIGHKLKDRCTINYLEGAENRDYPMVRYVCQSPTFEQLKAVLGVKTKAPPRKRR